MEAKFNIGDTVKVAFTIVYGDREYVGKDYVVKDVQMGVWNMFYALEGVSNNQWVVERQLELVSKKTECYPKTVIIGDSKIIWNPPYTILFEDWASDEKVKSVTKCLEGDTFNERDGYMFALAKMYMPEDVKAYFREVRE